MGYQQGLRLDSEGLPSTTLTSHRPASDSRSADLPSLVSLHQFIETWILLGHIGTVSSISQGYHRE